MVLATRDDVVGGARPSTCRCVGGATRTRDAVSPQCSTTCACRCCCCESPGCCCCPSFMLLEPPARSLDGCSSRSTPKPRAPQSTVRPNITFQTYTCPEAYAKWYCLNGATCFAIKIGESILYNCECADGYMGQRCEFKDLDGTYLPTRQRVLIEKAGLAGGVTLAVLLVFLIVVFVYLYYRRRKDKTYFDAPEEPKLFFCGKPRNGTRDIHPVLKQTDLERGPCDRSRRTSS
ncbi:protein spitz isoform X2 [Ixodes scapularis]|uniref:protein spitz isoform X2 n=1 Tax=Ixodes scapularis TaxID=6945 RepID=UPI0011619B4D|nr:protein spitz isoform X2 [Ixodes scapularis]